MFLEHDRNGINYSINVLFKPLSNPINLNSIPIMRPIGPDIYDTNTSVTLREKFICRCGKEIDQNLIKRSYAVLQLIPSQTISDETKKIMRDK